MFVCFPGLLGNQVSLAVTCFPGGLQVVIRKMWVGNSTKEGWEIQGASSLGQVPRGSKGVIKAKGLDTKGAFSQISLETILKNPELH